MEKPSSLCLKDPVLCLEVDRQKNRAFLGGEKSLRVVDITNFSITQVLDFESSIYDLIVSSNGEDLFLACEATSFSIVKIETQNWKKVFEIQIDNKITCMLLCETQGFLATCPQGPGIFLRGVQTGGVRSTLHTDPIQVNCLALASGGSKMFSGDDGGNIIEWKSKIGSNCSKIRCSEAILGLCFGERDEILFVGCRKSFSIIKVSDLVRISCFGVEGNMLARSIQSSEGYVAVFGELSDKIYLFQNEKSFFSAKVKRFGKALKQVRVLEHSQLLSLDIEGNLTLCDSKSLSFFKQNSYEKLEETSISEGPRFFREEENRPPRSGGLAAENFHLKSLVGSLTQELNALKSLVAELASDNMRLKTELIEKDQKIQKLTQDSQNIAEGEGENEPVRFQRESRDQTDLLSPVQEEVDSYEIVLPISVDKRESKIDIRLSQL